MLYQPDAPGDWGQMLESDTIKTATDILNTSDGCTIFLRSWVQIALIFSSYCMAWVRIAAGLSIWATNWLLAV